jgi:SAM-dependent methyltransferase
MDQARFVEGFHTLVKQQEETSLPGRFNKEQWASQPILNDDTSGTAFDAHYVYHTAWAIRKVAQVAPALHVDFGSSIYFVALASAIVPVRFYDFRPPALRLPNLEVRQGDLMSLNIETASLSSVSCMHVIEHVGLGRYGDMLDYDGDLVGMRELGRVVAPGGSLLFVVPIGQPRIVYNAHRIYDYQQIINVFAGRFVLKEFSLILDSGEMISDASKELADRQGYGCGCFHFIAKS